MSDRLLFPLELGLRPLSWCKDCGFFLGPQKTRRLCVSCRRAHDREKVRRYRARKAAA